MAKMDFKRLEAEFLRSVEDSDLKNNYLFMTTLKKYQVQLRILTDLEKSLDEFGMTVTKEYVKGRENLCANPAIAEYNRTADSAGKTAATLIRIMKEFGYSFEGSGEDEDPLMSVIESGEGNE